MRVSRGLSATVLLVVTGRHRATGIRRYIASLRLSQRGTSAGLPGAAKSEARLVCAGPSIFRALARSTLSAAASVSTRSTHCWQRRASGTGTGRAVPARCRRRRVGADHRCWQMIHGGSASPCAALRGAARSPARHLSNPVKDRRGLARHRDTFHPACRSRRLLRCCQLRDCRAAQFTGSRWSGGTGYAAVSASPLLNCGFHFGRV